MQKIIDNKHYLYLLLTILGGGLTFYFAVLGIIEHRKGCNPKYHQKRELVYNNP